MPNERLAPRILLRDDNEDGAGSDHIALRLVMYRTLFPASGSSGSPKGLLSVNGHDLRIPIEAVKLALPHP